MKSKGSKTFMSLSKKECLVVSQDCIANSNSKYNDAVILANSGSYGNATSQLMLSLEEMMKAIILSLDGNGFEFRNKVKGIGNIFENHKLRYFLAFILSVMNVFGQDLKKMLLKAKDNPETLLNLKMDDPSFQRGLTLWVITKMKFIAKEIVWFSNADVYRQDGFYVDYVDGVKTPLNITHEQFSEFKLRIDNFRTIGNEFISSFDLNKNTAELREEILKLQKRFVKDGYYTHLGNLVPKLNNRDYNAFEQLAGSISKVSSELQSDFKQGKSLTE